MATTYYAISIKDSSRANVKLQLFAGQRDSLSELIAIDKAVSDKNPSNIEYRSAFPVGSIFKLEGTVSFVLKHYSFTGTITYLGECYHYLRETSLLFGKKNPPTSPTEYKFDSYMASEMDAFLKFAESLVLPDGSPSYFDDSAPKTDLQRALKKHPCPSIEDDGFYVNKDLWDTLVFSYKTQQNLMLTGPTGVGKTEVLQMLVSKMGKIPTIIDMGTMQDPLSGLVGVHRLDIDENGQQVSNFDLAELPRVIATKNSVVVFDEISRAPSMANNILFPLLDSRGELQLNLASSKMDRVIKKHPTLRFFATANLGNEYTGASQLDRALIDRFMIAEVAYMPAVVEAKLLTKLTSISQSDAELITKTAGTIRELAAKGELSSGVSTRLTKLAANMVTFGMSITQALKAAFTPYYEGSEYEGERCTIYTIIKSK
jgi:MoxR-like ATPase